MSWLPMLRCHRLVLVNKLVIPYRRFETTYLFHLQRSSIPRTLKMLTIGYSETSSGLYHFTLPKILEECRLGLEGSKLGKSLFRIGNHPAFGLVVVLKELPGFSARISLAKNGRPGYSRAVLVTVLPRILFFAPAV
jgi:hypothetical protein